MTNSNQDAPLIIGVDNGFGNTKTRNCCFPTGVLSYDREPTFKRNLLVYDGRYYLIGEGHKEFSPEKALDNDHYVLTLAAVARELDIRGLTSARVHLAAGLPLTWVTEQKEAFQEYLLKNPVVDFTFRGTEYHVEFTGAEILPQGFAAVADKLNDFAGINLLADIGHGTMNVMYIIDRCPRQDRRRFTEKYGTNQCALAVRENLMRLCHATVDESAIEKVFRTGSAEISERYLTVIRDTATEYVEGIFRKLREREYDPESMRLYVVGGGACLVKNFGRYEPDRVTIQEDICATAKGYEYLAELKLHRGGGTV